MATVTSCTTGAGASNPACIPVMSTYCSTDDPGGMTYQQKWQGDSTTSLCREYVSLNTCNQNQYAPVVDAYTRRYLLTDAHPITYPQQGSLIYDPAIADVISVCQNSPGGCDNVLTQKCSGFTRDDLKSNPNMATLCGCFMSDQQYNTYQGAFGVQKICDPACVLQSAVKPKDPSNQCQALRCQQSICVIDDVTISILQNSTTGDISFGQACSSCTGGAGCVCDISDISLTTVQSVVKDINFSQDCGGVTNCFKRDANGIPQTVPCSALDSTKTSSTPTSVFTNPQVLIAVLILITLIIIIIIVALVASRKRDEIPSGRVPTSSPAPPIPAYSPGAYTSAVYGGPLSQANMIPSAY
jgi:hypothetical protein